MIAPYQLEFFIPGLPATPNARRHWRAVHGDNAKWYALVRAAVGNTRPKAPLQTAKLIMIRVSTSEPDRDNLCASFKPIIDGLRYAGVLVDDKKANIGMPDYRWERGQRGKGFIRVSVEEIASDPQQ